MKLRTFLILAALLLLAAAPAEGAQAPPRQCTWAADGTATCTFAGCDPGQSLSVAFEGTAPGGKVTATCGTATVTCTTGALRVCSDSVTVGARALTGTCTGSGLGAFSCIAY